MRYEMFIRLAPRLTLALLTVAATACKGDEEWPSPDSSVTPGETTVYADGFNYDLATLDADRPVTITFKAPEGTALYGTTGNLYLHSGVGSGWTGAPAWGDNSDKYKLTPVPGQSNLWSITLSPSVRSFYGVSADTPVRLLNLIVRTADKTLQTGDYTALVQDAQHGFTLSEPTIQAVPVSGDNLEGVHVRSASSATVVLYDRDTKGNRKEHAYLVSPLSDWEIDSRYQMNYDEAKSCWWITLEGLTPGETPYRFFVYSASGGGNFLADPYAEKVLEKGVDADFPDRAGGRYVSVLDTQPETYPWTVTDFKVNHGDRPVIYELLLRDFTASGDLQGAMEKLPYLKAMGVNAVELMPVQEFEGADSWGYNTGFYFALDGSYGTRQQYKAFVDACHREGIAVILDVVYNHTNDQNPFARLYWDYLNNRPSAENPWLNAETPHRKYVFSNDDFNHESALTRAFVKRNLAYLLETYRFDGFRFDFTKGFTQRQTTGDADLSAYDASRVAVLKEYRDAVKAVKNDAIVIMEHFVDEEETTLAREGILFWRNVNRAYCQSAMGWKEDSDFGRMYDAGLSSVGFMESHDEERMGYKQTQWGNGVLKTDLSARMKQLSANAAFFLTVPGPKMIWQFGELGYDFSINADASGTAVNEANRTARKPVRWDYYEVAERRRLYEVYASLTALRNAHPELFGEGAFREWRVGLNDWNNGRYLKLESGAKTLVVVGNFTSTSSVAVSASFGHTGLWNELGGGTLNVTSDTQTVDVPGHEFRVYTNF